MAIAKLCLIMSSAFNVSSLEDYKFYVLPGAYSSLLDLFYTLSN